MDINLSLNDFRSVLGKENDGNVVMKLDKTGIEKANYGSFFGNLFRTAVRKAASNPAENRQIRGALMSAIFNSAEAKVLNDEQLAGIYSALGMPDGLDAEKFSLPLTRRELKSVIDIIDGAVINDALLNKNIETISKNGLFDKKVAGGVQKAMDAATCFRLPAGDKARAAHVKAIFGDDFMGRSPAEMEKFVRLNMAVIREQLFDRLYWTNEQLKDFTEPDDVNKTQIMEVYEDEFVKVDDEKVTAAFRDVVGSLMEKFAAGKRVTTNIEKYPPCPEEFKIADENALGVWESVLRVKDEMSVEDLVDKVFLTTGEASGSLAAAQLKSASQVLKNMLRSMFSSLYVEKRSNSQETEVAFREKTAPLIAMLEEMSDDMDALGFEVSGKFLSKVAEEFGEIVFNRGIANNQRPLADAAMKALDNAAKHISVRSIVEDYVNDAFAYVQERKPVVDFFMSKIKEDGGITGAQRTALADYQRAAINGTMNDEVASSLKMVLMAPLATAYADAEAQNSPEKIKEARQARNDTALASLVTVKNPGFATKNEAQKAELLLKLKVEIAIAKFGHLKAYELGISDGPGSESIKKSNPGTPDADAIKRLDEQLLAMDDREFEFYSQYCAKGMRAADNNMDGLAEAMTGENHKTIFSDALMDGVISISSIPADAVGMLQHFIEAKIYATAHMNGGDDGDVNTVSIRDILPSDKQVGPLTTAMLVRLTERITAAGMKKMPYGLGMPKPNETQQAISYRLKDSAGAGFGQVRGFGTFDLGRILKLLKDMHIDLKVLEGDDINAKVDFFEKILSLSVLAEMSGFKLDGLAEFTERVTGKPFEKIDYSDVLKALKKEGLIEGVQMYSNITMADPLSKLKGDQKTVKELFAGELALSGADLAPEETASLLAMARDLGSAAPGTVKSAEVSIKGVTVKMTRLAGGELSVRMEGMPMRAAFDVHGLVRNLENEITSKPNSFTADIVKSTLPDIEAVKGGAVPLVRARELYAKTAAAKTGLLPVMFSSYSTEELRHIAIDAVDGKFTKANIPKDPPSTYNSGAMLEMHATLSHTSAKEVDSKVKIVAPPTRDINNRRTIVPDPQTVRNLVADLFLNKDTWEFDAGKAPGERIRKLILENEPELSFVIGYLNRDQNLLAYLPKDVRDAVKGVFEDIAKVIDSKANLGDPSALDGAVRGALSDIEAKIDAVADTLVVAMQDKVTKLFSQVGKANEAKPSWQKTFAELTGKEGIDVDTKQGSFTMTVLNHYFINSAKVDRRAMLSAFIRNTDEKSSDAKLVAEMLKGAGPLLQKMLQGLPLSSFNAETQLALKDMKSRLLPIPDEAVKAQMLELVNSSNGNILSIEVKKSLGAATVGQAFLCTIKTKTHPFAGEECVVKLLRPNVDTAIQREKAMIDKLVANDPAMKETFDGQYRKILEEFDLTLESTNVGIGTKFYELPKGVATLHSMQMLEGTTSTMTSMVVKKAEGTTFDAAIDKVRRDAEAILSPLRFTTEIGGVEKTVYKAPNSDVLAVSRRTLLAKAAYLNDRRNHILDVTKAWFENALFGNGFFHGDLHGGNLMTGTDGTTFIDFGNCSRLDENQQKAITMMLATTISGDVDHVISNFKKLLSQDAQEAFDAKFAKDSPAGKDLEALLKRGNAYDLMSRLQAFISAVQGEDVPIPPALQNFVQSYMRLVDIVTDIDHTVEDLQIAAASIYCDSPNLAPVENEPKIFAKYKAIARAYLGDANTPFSKDAVEQAITDAKNYAKTQECKTEIRNLLLGDNGQLSYEKALANVKPFCQQMENAAKSYTRNSLVPAENMLGRFQGVGSLLMTFSSLERLQQENKIPSEEANEKMRALETELGEIFIGTYSYFIDTMMLENDGESTFESVVVKRDKTMTDICCDVIRNYQDQLGDAAEIEFGGFAGKAMFALHLRSQFHAADAAATRRKNIGPAISKKNLDPSLSPDKRLTGQNLATLLRATDTFYVPLPRPDVKTSESRTQLLETIYYNLQRGAAALKVDHLSDTAAGFAALSFGLADGELAKTIQSLSNSNYNLLLADAGKLDAAHGAGRNELTAAIKALRDSEDLLNEVSEE